MITDYASLQTAIAGWLNRSDLTARIPDFIALAEAKFRRDVRAQNKLKVTITLASDNYSLPADLQELTTLRINTSTYKHPLSIVTPEIMGVLRSNRPSAQVPTHASVLYTTTGVILDLYPACDTNYAADLIYLQKTPNLTSGATTNWLITNAPDAYLFGALMQAAPYLADDERLPIWGGLLKDALESLGDAAQRAEYSAVKGAPALPVRF